MNSSVETSKRVVAAPGVSLLTQSLGALLFGLALFYAVGFASPDTIHNAAHDTRHTVAVPCH